MIQIPQLHEQKGPTFKELNGALQVRYRELRKRGVGAVAKHAAIVLPDKDLGLEGCW